VSLICLQLSTFSTASLTFHQYIRTLGSVDTFRIAAVSRTEVLPKSSGDNEFRIVVQVQSWMQKVRQTDIEGLQKTFDLFSVSKTYWSRSAYSLATRGAIIE